MPPVNSRRSGIPRLAGSKFTEVASSVIGSRKPRKSSSSDTEYTTSSDAARVKVGKPLKMQGPFRPSIVGRMAKKGECLISKGHKASSRQEGPVESNVQLQTKRTKSKSRSPPEKRPEVGGGKPRTQITHNVDYFKQVKTTGLSRAAKHVNSSEEVLELKKENKVMKNQLDSLSKEILACKAALEKCHIDPVTLEPISVQYTNSQDKETTLSCVQEDIEVTKKTMESLLGQNMEMLDGLKDLLKGLS